MNDVYKILKEQSIKKIEELTNNGMKITDINLVSLFDKIYEDRDYINVNFLKFLIENEVDINKIDEDGYSALIVSTLKGDFDIVKLLVEYGGDVNNITKDDSTPLLCSLDAENNNFELIKYFVEKGADINYQAEDGFSLFSYLLILSDKSYLNNIEYVSSYYDDISEQDILDLIQYLIDNGADLNSKINNTFSLFAFACIFGNIKMVKLLLENGANPNISIKGKSFFLFLLISSKIFRLVFDNKIPEVLFEIMIKNFEKNKLQVCELLIKYGAEIGMEIIDAAFSMFLFRNKNFVIPKINNMNINYSEKIKGILIFNTFDIKFNTLVFLLKNIEISNYKENIASYLITASKLHDIELIEFLLQYIDTINEYLNTVDSSTILFNLIKSNNYNTLEHLLQKGIGVDLKSCIEVIRIKDIKLINLLIKYIVNDNSKKLMNYCLLYAILVNNLEITKLLIDNGADANYNINYQINGQINSLELHFEIIHLLIDNDIYIKDQINSLSLYNVAHLKGYGEIEDLLELSGANINNPRVEKKTSKLKQDLVNFKNKQKDSELTSHEMLKQDLVNSNDELKDSILRLIEIINFSPFLKDSIDEKSVVGLQKLIEYNFDLKGININDLFINKYPSDFIYEVIRQSNDINTETNDGITPLMFAAKENNSNLIKLLLDKGAKKQLKNKEGRRAKDFANNDIRSLIIKYVVNKYNPQSLVKILTNFTEDKPMKFTTHDWDFGELSKSDYKNFDGYMAEVKTQWLAIKDDLKTLSPNLYKEVYNFLWETDSTEALGWSSMDGLKNWCNAGNKPFDFKDFKEIVNVFKRKIEIRKDTMLEDIFIQERKKLGRKYKVELIKLKGVTFYTDTEKLINVIKTIFSQMHEVERHEYTNIIVEVLGDSTKEFIELKIMQLGAQAGSDAYVMLEEVQNGDFAGIKENLNNLCDWSIESSYEDKNYRVNYLTSNTSETIEELNYKPNGFTHILRFYNK
ncbi:ankyrin repeat domain-containing protein [Poseidonibacter antarcticus]|uniref:ankyrin repeat domain-containing protein n=1 Tax=Poseidonibacter antarcticus TaxID=2478538 RepID=UPI000EF4E8D0|nr:ankyrin repeat domain-containing protein [Poseidonibacter antarcticus]